MPQRNAGAGPTFALRRPGVDYGCCPGFGVRAEEVGGLHTRVILAGDWRQIATKRLERNAILKAESVLGQVEETTYSNETRNTPAIRRDKNPTNFSSKGPEYQSIATKAVNDFKNLAQDKYTTVRLQANRAIYHSNDAYIHASNWNQVLATANQEMDQHHAKFTKLEEQTKNFKVKSSGFVKMIASGAVKLTTGKLMINNKNKIKVIASSLTELKGTVKLGG